MTRAKFLVFWLLGLVMIAVQAAPLSGGDIRGSKEFINSIGMKFVRIEPGVFEMGQLKRPLPSEILPLYRGRGRFDCLRDGDFDEMPVHQVKISRTFYMAATEVTNKQYELFAPEHRSLRGKNGLSKKDDEAVVYVSWYDADAFCRWLSDKEKMPYRLPTEAEWEYACRARTTTNYHYGDILPETFQKRGGSLQVGQQAPNSWGIYDMHGNVEEWCYDWYGPYQAAFAVDPVGYVDGDFRVTRGGSHSTPVYYLRSANRMATLPQDKHWLIGFRLVCGEMPGTKRLSKPPAPLNQHNVKRRSRAEVMEGPSRDKPYFKGPRRYVNIPTYANGPLFANHNHDPAVVECPNGDILAIWYTCVSEKDREMAQAASRLRFGADDWAPASPFWDVPDRNDHAPALWYDGKDTIYHFSGIAPAYGHSRLALVMRTSRDSGATWSKARLVLPEYEAAHMPSEPAFRMRDGAIALAVDHSGPWGNGSDLLVSRDEGLTWTNPGGHISGIHAGAVQLKDGRILGFGREGEFFKDGGKYAINSLPMSISSDGGKSYTWHESRFPGISGGQRLVLMRLREGPLLLASFAPTGIMITDSSGGRRKVRGLYAAMSVDEGQTWPYVRLVSDDGPGRAVECTGGGLFVMSERNAEYRGYLSACQGLDGTIHLISSRVHYAFNLEWLRQAPPPIRYKPVCVKPVTETFAGPAEFDAEGWADYHGYLGGFNGKGQYTINSLAHHNGINRIVGKGSFEAIADFKNIHYYPAGDGVSEGLVIWLKDDRAKFVEFGIKEDHIKIEVRDAETSKPLMADSHFRGDRGWIHESRQASFAQPPAAASVKIIWNEADKRLRILYGFNSVGFVNEIPLSKTGIRFAEAFAESTTIYLLMSNGRVDVDHFEIRSVVE